MKSSEVEDKETFSDGSVKRERFILQQEWDLALLVYKQTVDQIENEVAVNSLG